MKVVSAKQMQRIESQAYREGASESDFMEEAGSGIALAIHDFAEKHNLNKHIVLLCGKGNNGGDAYVAGVHLLHLDYFVTAYQLFPISESSYLCKQNYSRFVNEGGSAEEITDASQINWPSSGIIVDGIFGTGFHGEVEEPVSSIIDAANQAKLPIIAIDTPSGLNGETGKASDSTIVANTTVFLGLPKTGYFLRDGWDHVGKLSYVDFGLSQVFIDSANADMVMLSPDVMKPLMPKILRTRNKYQAGYVVGLSGSPTMPGAGQLASLSALRSGAGIVRLLYPNGMENVLAASPYELLKTPYDPNDVNFVADSINRASAAFVGPGLSVAEEMQKLISSVVPLIQVPTVLDADALTVLSSKDFKLPAECVLTPHMGELKRLMHITEAEITLEFLWKCHAYANQKNVALILKGGPTFIFYPGEPIVVNPRGDPGMATAGSGDVLTGTIAALLAQKLSPRDAAYLGVYLHGISGEYAADDLTSYSLTASDIINFYPDAFNPKNW